MGRWVKMEENDDDTISMSMDDGSGKGEQNFLLPFSFDMFFGMVYGTGICQAPEIVELGMQVVEIPNGVEP